MWPRSSTVAEGNRPRRNRTFKRCCVTLSTLFLGIPAYHRPVLRPSGRRASCPRFPSRPTRSSAAAIWRCTISAGRSQQYHDRDLFDVRLSDDRSIARSLHLSLSPATSSLPPFLHQSCSLRHTPSNSPYMQWTRRRRLKMACMRQVSSSDVYCDRPRIDSPV